MGYIPQSMCKKLLTYFTVEHHYIGPLYLTRIFLTPAWISNYIHYKSVCMKLRIHSQISTVQPLKFGKG